MKTHSFLKSGERTSRFRIGMWRPSPRGPHQTRAANLNVAALAHLLRGLVARVTAAFCFPFLLANACANPQGLTVVSGSAHSTQQGNVLQVTTSVNAILQWNSFNIAPGETTVFHQPSASSIVIDRINSANPSAIFGSLRANGIVVLENQSGFYFGPNAFVKAGGLVVTTAAVNPWSSAGGAGWSFDGLPAVTPIVNYGHLETASGGSLFLISKQIQNNGTISAPGGTAALLAGQEVLLSERPDGLSLAVPVKLPAGSVDNQGRIVADAGQVLLQAQTVNNSGVIQANSARVKNGVVELFASDDVQLTGTSVIQANGGSDGASQGGNITIKSGGTFGDSTGSQISATGGANGGNGGNVEISAPSILSLNSAMNASAQPGFTGGQLSLDPENIILAISGGGSAGNGTVTAGSTPGTTLQLNVNTAFANMNFSQIMLQATSDITLSPGTSWDLSQSTGRTSGQLTLQAGGDILLGAENNPSTIKDENNWSVTLDAGYNFATGHVDAGVGNVTLYDLSRISTAAGNITAVAGNDVSLESGGIVTGIANGRVIGGGGGNISVQALAGNVNCGSGPAGFRFSSTGAGYTVDPSLSGISTASGGNVTIQAGGSIVSVLPVTTLGGRQEDPGSGAFGAAPGNVTLIAGGDVIGHYVVANGTGTISAVNAGDNSQDISPGLVNAGISSRDLALDLIKGEWVVNATGNISLQEVRNPNGMFNNNTIRGASAPTQFLFNYDPLAAVVLNAGNGVTITGQNLPRISSVNDGEGLIFPPILTINAGPGGITLDTSISLFPSPEGTLNLTTTGGGNLSSATPGITAGICLSDSQSSQWQGGISFTSADNNQNVLLHLNDPNPARINISGSVSDIALDIPKPLEMHVTGNIVDSSATIQNLHPTDTSVISAGGEILDHSDYVILTLPVGEAPNFSALDQVAYPFLNAFTLAPAPNNNGILTLPNPNYNPVLNGQDGSFKYFPASGSLVYYGVMSPAVEQALLSMTTRFLTAASIEQIYSQSQPDATQPLPGYLIAGPGTLRINAASMNLGNSVGVISQGFNNDAALAPYTPRGANIDISLSGDLTMLSSSISSQYGGEINVVSGGAIDLGSALVPATGYVGIISVWQGNISVIADGDVNVDGSRIAAYDGGNIFVESLHGNVNAGTGGEGLVAVSKPYLDQKGGAASLTDVIPGSGILATSFPELVYGESSSQVGNITVQTPQGDITASKGGIVQLVLGPVARNDVTINLNAGSKNSDGTVAYVGNVDAAGSGVVGSQVDITATGNINGLVVASVSASVSALQNVNATVLSQGAATVSAGGTVSGTDVGTGVVSVTGGKDVASAFSSTLVNAVGAAPGSAATPTAPTPPSANPVEPQQLNPAQSNTDVASISGDGDDPLHPGRKPLIKEYVGRVTVLLPE